MEPYAPGQPDADHPLIVENLLGVAATYPPEVLGAIIEMLEDLHEHGRKSRYVRKLKDLPLFELKTQSRGGAKGGARVYFTFTDRGEALLMNAEVKTGDSPSNSKITEALEVLLAHRRGVLRF